MKLFYNTFIMGIVWPGYHVLALIHSRRPGCKLKCKQGAGEGKGDAATATGAFNQLKVEPFMHSTLQFYKIMGIKKLGFFLHQQSCSGTPPFIFLRNTNAKFT